MASRHLRPPIDFTADQIPPPADLLGDCLGRDAAQAELQRLGHHAALIDHALAFEQVAEGVVDGLGCAVVTGERYRCPVPADGVRLLNEAVFGADPGERNGPASGD